MNPPPTELMPTISLPRDHDIPPTILSPLSEPTHAYVPIELGNPSKTSASGDGSERNENSFGRIVLGFGAGVILAYFVGMFAKAPEAGIPLALFFGFVGALVGKFASSLVKQVRKT